MTRPAIPRQLQRDVLIEAGHRCAIPTCRQTPVEIAHIVPWEEVKEHTFDNLMALCPTCHTRFDKGEIDRKAMRQYKANLSVLTGREREASSRVETAEGGPSVLPLRLADDGGHNVEILNRGETDVWDVVIENHEPRDPPGIDQYRKGALPFIRGGATEQAFLGDEQHTYRIDRPGYGLRITWTDRDRRQTLSAHFFTTERKRGARFAIDDDARFSD